jgi:hypothetical protein
MHPRQLQVTRTRFYECSQNSIGSAGLAQYAISQSVIIIRQESRKNAEDGNYLFTKYKLMYRQMNK